MDLLLLSFSLKSCTVVSPSISFFLQVFRLQSYVGGFAIVVIFFEVLYCCFTLYFFLFIGISTPELRGWICYCCHFL